MNDRAVALLEQYEIEVLRTRKGRGAILCDTQRGCLIFKEYTGREEQLRLQERVLKHLEEQGTVPAERLLATKEGALSVTDRDGVRYILKTWWEGRECNIRDREECMEAMRHIIIRPLNQLSAEEDFILGAMLGYDLCQQCKRYCNKKEGIKMAV